MTMLDRLSLTYSLLDRPMRRAGAGLTLLMLLNAVMESIGVSVFLPLIETLSGVEGTSSRWLKTSMTAIGISDPGNQIIVLLLGISLIFLLKALCGMALVYVQYRFVWDGRTRIASRLMDAYLAAPYETTLSRPSSTLLRNVTSGVSEVLSGSILSLSQLLSEVVVMFALLALLLYFEPVPTLLSGSILGITMLFYLRLVRRKLQALGQEGNRTSAEIIATATGNLGALREIKLAARDGWFATRFHNAIAANSAVQWRYSLLTATPKQLLELILVICIVITVSVFITNDRPVQSVLSTLGLFAAAAFRLMPSMNRIATNIGSLRFGTAILEQLVADLGLRPCPRQDGFAPPSWTRLHLEGLGYSYPGAERPILSNIDLAIARGEAVALVGPSGAGKTTLANVLAGLLPATSGRITADGAAIEPGSRSWQSRIGYVPQDVVLLDDTLAANIAFGEAPDHIDRDRLARAVTLAQLNPLVDSLPHGLDTPLGERGKSLSGGQRQRVGIARTLYRDADILILDEATSALDAETEAAVTEAIHALKGSYTLIIIAHRLSTVRDCDKLVMMVDGCVADTGTFAELNQRNDSFARMVRHMDLSSALEP